VTRATSPPAVEEAASILGRLGRRDEPIGARTTYRVGGAARLLVEIDGPEDLDTVGRAIRESGVAVLVLGKGSNVLVADRGFPGLCLVLSARHEHVAVDAASATVRAGGATAFPLVARRSAAGGLRGLEWAVGIPGSVGGAVAMNAGGHGAETAQCLVSATVAHLGEGTVESVPTAALGLAYRSSALRATDLVLEAEFRAAAGDPREAEALIDEIVRWRREHQPGGRNGGSVFTNPPGDAAGRLIEEAGLKGFRIGTAVVSDKHANFFQADPGGSADDVRRLIDHVRDVVAAHSGVVLEPELRLVGFDG